MNKDNLLLYTALANFLGKTLGSQYEIILYVLESGTFHIATIENSHVSGRTIQSPLTEFTLNLIQSEKHVTHDYATHYKYEAENGKKLRGSTFFIKGKNGVLEGMLCINQDVSRFEELSQEILALANLSGAFSTTEEKLRTDFAEGLDESIESIVYSIVSPELLDQKATLSKELKVEIVRRLNEKSVFQVKGAVARVSEILNISEPSVYRYIKMVEHV